MIQCVNKAYSTSSDLTGLQIDLSSSYVFVPCRIFGWRSLNFGRRRVSSYSVPSCRVCGTGLRHALPVLVLQPITQTLSSTPNVCVNFRNNYSFKYFLWGFISNNKYTEYVDHITPAASSEYYTFIRHKDKQQTAQNRQRDKETNRQRDKQTKRQTENTKTEIT